MRKWGTASCCIERANVSDMTTNKWYGAVRYGIHKVRGSLVLVVLGMAQVDVRE